MCVRMCVCVCGCICARDGKLIAACRGATWELDAACSTQGDTERLNYEILIPKVARGTIRAVDRRSTSRNPANFMPYDARPYLFRFPVLRHLFREKLFFLGTVITAQRAARKRNGLV